MGGNARAAKYREASKFVTTFLLLKRKKKDSAYAAKPNQRLCPCTSLGVPARTLIMCSHSALGMCSKCSLEFYLN